MWRHTALNVLPKLVDVWIWRAFLANSRLDWQFRPQRRLQNMYPQYQFWGNFLKLQFSWHYSNWFKSKQIRPWIRPLIKELFVYILFVEIQLQICIWWELILSQGFGIRLWITIFLTLIERAFFRDPISLTFGAK